MKRDKKIILPKIYEGGANHDKPWFIYFSVYDELNGGLKRFRIYDGFKSLSDYNDLKQHGEKLCVKYRRKLKNGWNPFDDDSKEIYEDHLTYQMAYKKRTYNRRSRESIRKILSDYLEKKNIEIRKSTYQRYQSHFRIFMEFIDKKKWDHEITSFNEKKARMFFEYLKDERISSGKTLNSYKRIFKCVWDDFKKKNKAIENPWYEIPSFPNNTVPQKPFKRGMIELIKDDLQDNDAQLWLAAQFIYYCFIRPGELRFLKIKDINFYDATVTIPADISKNHKSGIVDISTVFLKELIKEYKLNGYPDNYYLFTLEGMPGKKPVGKNYFSNHFEKCRKRLSLPRDYILYAFKHTGNVVALKSGANITDLKDQNRHSSIAITEEYLKSKVGYESDFFRNKMPGL